MKTSLPSIWLLSTIALASPFALNAFNPALPDVVRALDSDISVVQLTLTLYMFSLGISQLLSGALADRYGRRPLMLAGMVINLGGSLLAAFAPNVDVLIIARILQALGGGAMLVLVRAMILDAHGRDQAGKFLSYINMAIAVAQTIAPTIGGYLNYYFDWRAIFYFTFVLNFFIGLLMFRQLHETSDLTTNTPFRLGDLLRQYAGVLKSRVYMAYAFTGSMGTCAYLAFASIMPYIYIDQMGGTSAEYGNWFLLVSGGYFAGSLIAARITERFGLDRMISGGAILAILAAGLSFALIIHEVVVAAFIFALMGLVTLGRGLLLPNAQSGAVSSVSESRGTASGMMGFMQLMLATGVTQLMPVLYGLGLGYVFGAVLGLMVLVLGFHWVAVR
ncbi:MAG: multidrug effflux MFS transporter [Thiolinea sp.]